MDKNKQSSTPPRKIPTRPDPEKPKPIKDSDLKPSKENPVNPKADEAGLNSDRKK